MHTRRALLLIGLAAYSARADERTDILDIVSPLATALADEDATGFLAGIDPEVPDYGRLRDFVMGLLNEAWVSSSVDLVRVKGDVAELDWSMRLRAKSPAGGSEERRQTLTVKIDRKRKKIVALEPVAFFRPMTVVRREK